MRKYMILLSCLLLLLAACGSDDTLTITDTEDTVATTAAPVVEDVSLESISSIDTYVANPGDFAGKTAADWDNAEVVRIELDEMSFSPNDLTFEAGLPYKVELVNVGKVKHEFTSEAFFASVAWRKAESAQSEVKAPYFTEVEVFAGQQVDLYFVPITPGIYDLVCEIEGHFEAGMFGAVTVTGNAPTDPTPNLVAQADGPWLAGGSDIVSAADWDTMETIEINLGEYYFEPNEIHLAKGQPYKILFINEGEEKHEATAPEFFLNIAFRKVQDASGEYKTPAPLEVETFAGMETELFLIPMVEGTYDLVCEIEGHFEAGMFGTIVVDPEGTTAAAQPTEDTGTYVQNPGDFAGKAAADWDNAEVVRIELDEMSFNPAELTFEAGLPYKVELVNIGEVKHEFTSEEFFASVAWRKAESPQSEVKAPFFTEIEVFAGQQVDLYFVPITPGIYDLVCEIEGHFEAGMFGSVTVTGTAPTNPAPVIVAQSDGPWLAGGSEIVSAADWDSMETIEVELGEFYFEPSEIHLTQNQPYKIVFINVGDVKHESTAPDFFLSIAFRKVQDASGEYKTPAPLEVETFAGMETELFLIPTATGTFDLVCEIEGHFEAGMFGTIVVDPAS